MIPLDDRYSKKLVLEHLVSCIDSDVNDLLIGGLTPEALEAMKDRPARDLMRVAEMHQFEVKVQINSSALLSCFQRLDSMKRQQELKEYFVLHGATPDMLASLFKISLAEIRTMRAALCKQSLTSGRPPKPDLEKSIEIYKRWEEIAKQEQDIREQFYLLHQQFPAFPLSSLWATICEFKRTAYIPEQTAPAASCGNVTSPTVLS